MERLIEHLRDTLALANLVGGSPVFLSALAPLPAVARSDATVLISGETGTGKELVARAIHYSSPRAAFPFVPANCGRLPDTLLEDELFGHERGAFTDARTQRSGLIAQAEKGTLFLDEVEALSAKAQVVLLRVLEDKKYLPLGSSLSHQADIRIIVATNAPLAQMVRDGSFRTDLYYRLCVFLLNLPPLRARKDDIIPLAHYFLKKHAPTERDGLQLAPSLREAMLAYDWPGNVRELENAIIRGIHFCQTDTITLQDIGTPFNGAPRYETVGADLPELYPFREMKKKAIAEFERSYLTRLMQDHHGNVSHAAIAASIERRQLGKMLKKYRIDPKLVYTSLLNCLIIHDLIPEACEKALLFLGIASSTTTLSR